LIFNCSLDWNQHRMEALLWCKWRHKECDGGAEKAFTKWLPETFPILRFAGSMYSWTRGLFLRKCSLNYCTLLYFSKLKRLRKIFEATTYITSTNSDSHNVLSSKASSHMSQVATEVSNAKG
jgi:hypothetical protein